MRNTSSPSVKIRWLDRGAAIERVRRVAVDLAARYPEVERVILFGSLATGRAVPGSDADLLIVLEACDLPFLDRLPRYTLACGEMGIDPFPYTLDEIEALRHQRSFFINQALKEGILLFERSEETQGRRW